MSENTASARWNWMMDYCRRQGLPPAEDWVWSKAEKAYEEFCQRQTHPARGEGEARQ